MKEMPPSEREITLDDLAKRHPDTARDVNLVVFEIPPPPQEKRGGLKGLLRDTSIGVIAGIIAGITLIWLVYFLPTIAPV